MSRNEFAAVAIAATAFACLFAYPLPTRLEHVGSTFDWLEFLTRNWVSTRIVTQYHQVPLWNPYACGGMPLLAHPSSAVLSPLFLLQVLFGAEVGLQLQVLASLSIAWSGGYVLARSLGMKTPGAVTCASVFPSASWFSLHVAVGHMNFLPATYLPWIATAVILGLEGRWWAWPTGGLLIALTFGAGGLYSSMHAVVLVIALTAIHAARERRAKPIFGLLALLACAFGFAAPKLLPSFELIAGHPRPIFDTEHNAVADLLRGLFSFNQSYERPPVSIWGFWESGAYVSPLIVALALCGALRTPRRMATWSLLAVLFFMLAIGGSARWLPWVMLHALRGFSSLRVPSRFLIPFTLTIGVLAASGVDRLAQRSSRLAALAWLLLALGVGSAWFVARPNWQAVVAADVPEESPQAAFRQVYGDTRSMFALPRLGLGALHCNEELDFSDVTRMNVLGSNQDGYPGEYYVRARPTPSVTAPA